MFLQKNLTPKKKKKDVEAVEEEIFLMAYPDGFTAHIGMAIEWLMMKNRSNKVPSENEANRACNHFEHPKFENILYQIFSKDVKKLVEYMPKRPYGLILVDIPYSFNLMACMHNDKEN
jgi:hypothetical protein